MASGLRDFSYIEEKLKTELWITDDLIIYQPNSEEIQIALLSLRAR
jgi:hypothetical protein